MTREDFIQNNTVLIQGPFNPTSFLRWESFLKYGKVLVSTWDIKPGTTVSLSGQDVFSNQIIKDEQAKGLRVVSRQIPDREAEHLQGIDKSSTFFWALNSIYNGLINIDTEYVIKVRSDEYYSNLTPLIERFIQNDNKIVCGNIFVRREIPYHFGDHLFVCKTKDLRKAIKGLLDSYNAKTDIKEWMKQKTGLYTNVAECILCLAILHAKRKQPTIWDDANIRQINPKDRKWIKYFLRHGSIVDINKLGKFTACWAHGFLRPNTDKGTSMQYNNRFINHHGVYDDKSYRKAMNSLEEEIKLQEKILREIRGEISPEKATSWEAHAIYEMKNEDNIA